MLIHSEAAHVINIRLKQRVEFLTSLFVYYTTANIEMVLF